MNIAFPFDFPLPTAFYLVLYVVTLIIHVVLMNYVLAGSAYLAFVSVFTGGPSVQRHRSPLAMLLRDWMPFMLSGAITAGVAPLLFIQILYKKNFYTSNLLLNHRWMIILPVLIVGFYLCYVLKSKVITSWPRAARLIIGLGIFASFLFVAYTWTENHLLSIQKQATWSSMYESKAIAYLDAQQIPRLAVWFLGSFPTLALIAAWQIRGLQRRAAQQGTASLQGAPATIEFSVDRLQREAPRLALLGLIGLGLAVLAGGWFWVALSDAQREAILSPMALPYVITAMIGLVLQAAAWILILRSRCLCAPRLSLALIGLLLSVTGATVAREALRIRAIDLSSLYDQHAAAMKIGGLPVFLLFFALSAVVIAGVVLIVRRGLQGTPANVAS